MVPKLRCPAPHRNARPAALAAMVALALACLLPAQEPSVHYYHQGVMPPGAIGAQQIQRGGPLPGYLQPVEIKAPMGATVALASAGQFEAPQAAPIRVGLLIAPVYRLRVTNIPQHPGEEVFPTVEVVDRLYSPQGQERRFSIPVELTQDDLELALAGKLVTRVIYVEDPERALPVRTDAAAGQNWFEVSAGRDPLAIADQLGRPVAILRLGGRVPLDPELPDHDFLAGCPPYEKYPPRMKVLKPPPKAPAAARPPAAPEAPRLPSPAEKPTP